MNFNPILIIPSRLAAVRFPNKPLESICGKPMILHVMERALKANVGPVVVACGDEAIKDVVEEAGGRAVLTNPSLTSGTDRVYAALEIVDPNGQYDVVINLQGDLPTIVPKDIQKVILPLQDPKFDISTLCTPILNLNEKNTPTIVKIAMGMIENNMAEGHYFSRSPIPYGPTLGYHHMGIYAYRRPVLEHFMKLEQSLLERSENLEQLRALEAGYRFGVYLTHAISLGVDTPADLAMAEQILMNEQSSAPAA